MNANPKSLKSRIQTLVKNTEEFDAPPPPRPAPPPVPYPFSRDIAHNPLAFNWSDLIPDLAVLDGYLSRDADITGLRFVSRLEMYALRRASSTFRRNNSIPVTTGRYTVIMADSRRRFQNVLCPDSLEYTYITTAPYPEWLANDETRNEALAQLVMADAGI